MSSSCFNWMLNKVVNIKLELELLTICYCRRIKNNKFKKKTA